MQLAHKLRRTQQFKYDQYDYRTQMSIALKEAHRSIAQTKAIKAERKLRFQMLQERQKTYSTHLKAVSERRRAEREARGSIEFTEMDIAKAAYATDQKDKALGLNVRYW